MVHQSLGSGAPAPGRHSFKCLNPYEHNNIPHRCGKCRGCQARKAFVWSLDMKCAALGHASSVPVDPDRLHEWVNAPLGVSGGFRAFALTLTFRDEALAGLPAWDADNAAVVAAFEKFGTASWRSCRDALTLHAVLRGPAGVRCIRSASSKRRNRRVYVPAAWVDKAQLVPAMVDYPPGHRFRLPMARARRRLVHYVGRLEVSLEGRLHAHVVVLLPRALSPAIFWSAWPYGHVDVEPVSRLCGAIRYVVNYATDPSKTSVGRVFRSHRLPIGDRWRQAKVIDARTLDVRLPHIHPQEKPVGKPRKPRARRSAARPVKPAVG